MQLQTIKFIKENNNWKELLKEAPYFLTIKEDNHYYLLKYNQLNSDFSNEIVKECRGLIIDRQTLEPIALSFKKFWEVENELADTIDWSSAKVQEKCDGSKILCFYDKYENKWQIATSGELNAYKATVSDFGLTFGDLFDKALIENSYTHEGFVSNLLPNYCYTFELVSLENRVVVRYKKPDLYFIGVRNTETFEEMAPKKYEENFGFLIKTPNEYPLTTLEECIEATKQMSYNQEGYVVVDNNWNRIKIKSPAWKLVSHIRGEGILTQKKILQIIEMNNKKKILQIYPEWKPYIDKIETKIRLYKHDIYNAIDDLKDYVEENELYPDSKEHCKKVVEYITEYWEPYKDYLIKWFKLNHIVYFVDTEWNKLSTSRKIELLGDK